MGCDIHVHTEVKINGEWRHWGAPSVSRNYSLFEKMAGVRGEVSNAIVAPRGLPSDITFETRFDFGPDEDPRDFWHSASWLSAHEIGKLSDWWDKETEERGGYKGIESEFGYLMGNGWNVEKYPNDHPQGVQDARWVFWFDN